MAGIEPGEAEAAQPAQPVEVGAERAAARRDEDAPDAEHGVAGERAVPGDEDDVVLGVAGDVERAERAEARRRRRARRSAPGQRIAATGGSPSASRIASTPSAWSGWSCVSAIPPAPPRAATSAATAATCAGIAGPGSTTQAGSRPTIQVFVPSSV